MLDAESCGRISEGVCETAAILFCVRGVVDVADGLDINEVRPLFKGGLAGGGGLVGGGFGSVWIIPVEFWFRGTCGWLPRLRR